MTLTWTGQHLELQIAAMDQVSLSGEWEFRFDEDHAWRPIPVPGCWEMLDVPKERPGPAWYRTRFIVPPAFAGRRLWLRFGAVSYHCAIWVNGRQVGQHTGLWDAFAVEITDAVVPGAAAELIVRVEKPASLTRGPSSEPVAGRFPLRETLSGFLPYVWGQIFGGIWQDVVLAATGATVFEDVGVRGGADGRVQVEATLSAPGLVTLGLYDPGGRLVVSTAQRTHPATASVAAERVRFEVAVPDPQPWSPDRPALYQAHLRVEDGDERTVRFGLRTLRADGTTITLNGRPLYPRMALSWGWYADALHSNPGPERVRADFERLRQLGYNGVKLCLWFPPQYYFDLADALGMLLWVELPMWLPQPGALFRRQTPIEYERLVRMARNHPSVILYSLGCELNRTIGAEILEPLYRLVKGLAGDALVRDNSGSGEAYGGLLNEFADYYDYHFYSELHVFRGLLDYFSPRWRPALPWLFGEFCDCDTFRDLRRLDDRRWRRADERSSSSAARPLPALSPPEPSPRLGPPDEGPGGEAPTTASGRAQSADESTVRRPWWLSADPRVNPQGARWQFDIVEQEARLRANGLWERGAELERISEQQALLHRKFTLELVRSYREVSGYVVTGEVDTPISTAGMWDDLGRVKFDPVAFRAFNADLVLLVGWDKHRAWIAGGDRAAPWDTWSYPGGALVRPHLIASHYGRTRGAVHVAWEVAFPAEPPFAAGTHTTGFALAPGEVRELVVAEFVAPEVTAPRQATLRASIRIGDETAENAWPLWFFPRDAWAGIRDVALLDPIGRLRDLASIAPGLAQLEADGSVGNRAAVIATVWSPALAEFVAGGGRAVLLQSGAGPPGPLPTAELPFWREAIRLVEPHAAWRDFPCDPLSGLQFFGCATDHALETSAMVGRVSPILRRLDARTMRVHDYAAELAWGRGRLIVTTLRLDGGQGEQPLGISRNIAAAYLLSCWVRYVQE